MCQTTYKIKLYRGQRIGFFSLHKEPARYTENGWEQEVKPIAIIGEDSLLYVTEFRNSAHYEWVGDKTVQVQYTLPIGIHKSRLIGWEGQQLSIFNQ